MTFNPLPPQAYTKETLLKAYQWLMGQNSSLKEIATTPDILVSLYLKATRDGDHSLERPSIQNFKNELRSLAGMMGELDRPAVTQQPVQQQQPPVQMQPQQAVLQQQVAHQPAPPPVVHHAAPQAYAGLQMHTEAPVQQQLTPAPQFHAQAHSHVPAQTTSHHMSYTEKTLMATTQTTDIMSVLDCGTRAMIQEVKDEFNLSSDVEALRMLVKIGHSRSKGMLA